MSRRRSRLGAAAVALLVALWSGGRAAGESGSTDALSGYRSLRWNGQDLKELVDSKRPREGAVVLAVRPVTLEGPDGAEIVPAGSILEVRELGVGEMAYVAGVKRRSHLGGWVSLKELIYDRQERLIIEKRTFSARPAQPQELEAAARWDERFHWKGIDPETIRVFINVDKSELLRVESKLFFCADKLVQTARTYSFPGPKGQTSAGSAALVDSLQKRHGYPLCRIADPKTVVCTWENEQGILILPVQGSVKAVDLAKAVRRRVDFDDSAWSVLGVKDLGPQVRTRGGQVIASRHGTYLMVIFSVLNKESRERGRISHPVLTDDAGRQFNRFGGPNHTLHNELVRQHAENPAAESLHLLSRPLSPGIETVFHAIYEVPQRTGGLALLVSSFGSGEGQLIVVDDLWRKAGEEPEQVTRRGDVWELLDPAQPVNATRLYAASAHFPKIRTQRFELLVQELEESLR